jgi:uncharacterized protein (TIGR03118 family)
MSDTVSATLGLAATATPTFLEFPLISDTATIPAAKTDPNLVNAWGISFPPTGPFWISDQGTGKTSVDAISGATITINAIPAVTVPSPTGQVFNSFASTGAFMLPSGSPATFLFASTNGNIYGWNAGATAVPLFTSPTPAAYTGLAITNTPTGPMLFAANNRGGVVDMINGAGARVGSFAVDPAIPPGFGPYNVSVLGGFAYVTYSEQDRSTGPGLGFVDKYDLTGKFVGQVAAGGPLDAPWGMTIAPASFGAFAGDLLVGNFGDGKINVFDPTTNGFLGQLAGSDGAPLSIDGLWALTPGNGGSAGDPNTIYFSAGPVSETHGLFGAILPGVAPAA